MTSRELAFTADTGADRLNTDARPRMASLRLGEISTERKNLRAQKMWEIAGRWVEAERQQGVDAERERE